MANNKIVSVVVCSLRFAAVLSIGSMDKVDAASLFIHAFIFCFPLQALSQGRAPLLELLDLSQNKISSESHLCNIGGAIPELNELKVLGNPFLSKKDKKDLVAVKRDLVAAFPAVELLDGSAIERNDQGVVVSVNRPCTSWGNRPGTSYGSRPSTAFDARPETAFDQQMALDDAFAGTFPLETDQPLRPLMRPMSLSQLSQTTTESKLQETLKTTDSATAEGESDLGTKFKELWSNVGLLGYAGGGTKSASDGDQSKHSIPSQN